MDIKDVLQRLERSVRLLNSEEESRTDSVRRELKKIIAILKKEK